MSERSESNGAGWGSRNPVSSLENLHINRYTNPATAYEIPADLPGCLDTVCIRNDRGHYSKVYYHKIINKIYFT